MASSDTIIDAQKHSVFNSTFPVFLPGDATLHMSEKEFQEFLTQQLYRSEPREPKEKHAIIDDSEPVTVAKDEPVSSTSLKRRASAEANNYRPQKAPFISALEKHTVHLRTSEDLAADNQALTQNADVTNISAKDVLVDLFYDLGESTRSEELKTLLENAWSKDSLLTLKIIFNARSIHLGKSHRIATYKAMGWLAENHPLTLLSNLVWLVRPVIAKKPARPEEKGKNKEADTKGTDEDFDMVDADDADPAKAHDAQFGMSHGYWKDLLNLVVFSANDELKFDGNPSSLLNQNPDKSRETKRKRNWDQQTAKEHRHRKKQEQNERVQNKLKHDPFYRALHTLVARLFAEQLKADKALLDSGKKSDLKKLSLAAKWAPSFGEFHDKHTFILSSIAEILFPDPSSYTLDGNRELYLRQIREQYRKQYGSPLRKALSVVERDIAAGTFKNIKYDRVPSLAMDRYTGLFMEKDSERFTSYIQKVATGSAKISGATLLPSTLVSKAREAMGHRNRHVNTKKFDFKGAKKAAEAKVMEDVIDGQWKTLVKRVRDAGTLQSSIAVCDVSGSMTYPKFKDGSCPMDSAIGLSLLISNVTAPPFGRGFITFSATPTYISMDDSTKGLVDQVQHMERSDWGMSTNFVAVFEDVILPMAIANKLKPEDMVKQIFVFSDMQFDSAFRSEKEQRWTTSYERIKTKYAEAGYEVPRLIFWNLASNSTSKPTTMDDVDTALVSGYSQGMLRAFLENGAFEDEEEMVEEEVEVEGAGGMTVIEKVKKKADPLTVVKKAVDHDAYRMLEVVD
ncbi:hypothetical protein DDE82_002809 [Stemphylium lycopersici]|nr:hypothetical protein TW65_06010 [Stemphylium lycopersici]RAR07523.1 hypothetical protein DDE82_002809 [Stemphylium lycopersici]